MKHTITINREVFSLSEEQYAMLLKPTVTAKDVLVHPNQSRMNGLTLKKLFEFNGRSYKRTEKGRDLLKAFTKRDKERKAK